MQGQDDQITVDGIGIVGRSKKKYLATYLGGEYISLLIISVIISTLEALSLSLSF